MTELITERKVDLLAGQLDRFDPEAAARRLKQALRRERANSAQPDGWSEGAGDGGNGSGPKVTVDLEDGTRDTVDVTAVELAVMRRERPVADPYRTGVRRASQAFQNAVRQLDQCLKALDALDLLDDLRDDDAGLAPDPGCWAMARVDSWEPIFRRTKIGNRYFELGRWAYDFVGRAGRLPTEEECRRHAEGRKVMLPAAVVTRWTTRV